MELLWTYNEKFIGLTVDEAVMKGMDRTIAEWLVIALRISGNASR